MSIALTEQEYRLLVENSPVMLWRAGLDAKCDYFNDTWLAYTGRTLQPFEMEYRLRRHDGEQRWIFDRGVPYTDDTGEFAGFIGSCVDVDERRRAQDAREKRDQEQLALAREFEQWILAIVSHDIRNPLGAIDGSARLLAKRAEHDDQMKKIADRIGRSTARITSIVGDLLDITRERHGGGVPIVASSTDLCALCLEVAEEIRSFATDCTIEVVCTEPSIGLWDGARISQALSNLLGNAVKHGDRGTQVDVRVTSDTSRAVVEVHNAGAIPADMMASLFEPFASRNDRSRHRDGLGLGLFIAQSIARAHRGELLVDSSMEHGTTFRLVLPHAA